MSCAKKMLNIHNASFVINEFVRNDNRFDANNFARNDNHSNINDFVHDNNHFNKQIFQYKTSSFDFKQSFVSIIQSSLTFTIVVLFSYIIFQTSMNFFISNQITIENLYRDQMIIFMTQSFSYNEIASYETSTLLTNSIHVQFSESFDRSMSMSRN